MDSTASEDAIPLGELVERDLREGGLLSEALPGYEERPAQIEMARRVAQSLETGEHLVLEAPTGVGKSLAYLLPIVRSGKVALVSTANKALQEQLFYKDIPFVQQHVEPFHAALVKGMGNYLCLDLLEEERAFQQYTRQTAFAQDGGVARRLRPLGRRPRPAADGPHARYTRACRRRQRPLRLAGLRVLSGLLCARDARGVAAGTE